MPLFERFYARVLARQGRGVRRRQGEGPRARRLHGQRLVPAQAVPRGRRLRCAVPRARGRGARHPAREGRRDVRLRERGREHPRLRLDLDEEVDGARLSRRRVPGQGLAQASRPPRVEPVAAPAEPEPGVAPVHGAQPRGAGGDEPPRRRRDPHGRGVRQGRARARRDRGRHVRLRHPVLPRRPPGDGRRHGRRARVSRVQARRRAPPERRARRRIGVADAHRGRSARITG